jgi:flagellar motor switch/type III secretory pathway protein FliN
MVEVGAGGEAATAVPNLESDREIQQDARWTAVLVLPCELIVDLPLPDFTIGDLLKLRKGSVINAHWRLGRDVPLQLNGLPIGWSEFEVVGSNLAVRLTDLV